MDVERALLMRRAARRVGVPRVQALVVEIEAERAVPFVGAGLREDLDAAPARKLKLRGKRIVVDAYLANRFLRRNLAVRETVDFDFRATLRIGRAGKRLQRGH